MVLKKIGRAGLSVLAAAYFAVDALFWGITWPLRRLIALLPTLVIIERWVKGLPPWACAVLLVVPLAILEPVKPLGAYLMASGHFKRGVAIIVLGEIIKLTLVERLFALTKDKLLEIPAFAWCYERYETLRDALRNTAVWRKTRDIFDSVRRRSAEFVKAAWLFLPFASRRGSG